MIKDEAFPDISAESLDNFRLYRIFYRFFKIDDFLRPENIHNKNVKNRILLHRFGKNDKYGWKVEGINYQKLQ